MAKSSTPTAVLRAKDLSTRVERIFEEHPEDGTSLMVALLGVRQEFDYAEKSLKRLPRTRQVTIAYNRLTASRARVETTLLGQAL